MQAETVYNVVQALSEAEKERLYTMLGVNEKVKEAKPDTKFLTKEQYTDLLLKQLNGNKSKKFENKMKAI